MSQQGRSAHLTYRGVLGAFIVAERKQAGAASDLFKLAQRCKGLGEFEDKCLEAEKFYLSDAAGQMKCQKLPAKYTQAKSDIRGAFKAGLDLNKIPSYHKMKLKKRDANAEQAEPVVVPERVTPAVPDGVIVVPSEGVVEEPAPAEGNVIVLSAEGKPRSRSHRDPRDAKPDNSLEAALASGQVIDAKSNLVVPEELAAIMPLFAKLNDHKRQQLAARWLKDTRDALSQQGMRATKRGARHGNA